MTFRILVYCACFFIVSDASAQQLAMKSHIINNGEEFDFGKPMKLNSGGNVASPLALKQEKSTAPSDLDINFLPMFGGFEKTAEQLMKDEMFLSECDNSFVTRKEASDFFAKMGWTYLEDGEKSNAINRFNYAFLLNPNNVDAFWGLGVIEYQQKNYAAAIDLISKGLQISPDNYVMMVDLATIHIQFTNNSAGIIENSAKARMLLDKAIMLKPEYEAAYTQLILLNILENKTDEAWQVLHKSYAINPNSVNEVILKELLSRKPDPMGVFK